MVAFAELDAGANDDWTPLLTKDADPSSSLQLTFCADSNKSALKITCDTRSARSMRQEIAKEARDRQRPVPQPTFGKSPIVLK